MSTRGGNTTTAARERPARLPTRAANTSPSGRLRAMATTLHATEASIAGLPLEQLHAYTPDGREIMTRQGKVVREEGRNGQGVYFSPAEMEQMRGAVVTHNHPAGSSLSAADIRRASEHGFAQIRAVTPDYRFTMSAPKGKPWPAWDGPRGMGAAYERITAQLMPAWRDEYLAGRVTHAQANLAVTHGALDVLAHQFGLRYHAVPRRADAPPLL